MTAPTDDVVVASYNVHGFVGSDGRRDLGRVRAVLEEIGADVVALQEVDCTEASGGTLELELLGSWRDRQVVPGATMLRPTGEFGNAVLSGLEIRRVRRHDLSVPGREPRGALDLDLESPAGHGLRLLTTHLGLRRRERTREAARLVSRATSDGGSPTATVLVGDLNEWWPRGGALGPLREWLSHAGAPRTFPARWPLLALDRCLVRPAGLLVELRAHRSPLASVASDHLPLVARLRLGG